MLIFNLHIANDQSGQVLPTMKETGYGVVTQGTVNRNVKPNLLENVATR